MEKHDNYNYHLLWGMFSSVQFSCSVMSDSATPWTAACQASLSFTNSWILLKLMSSSWRCHPITSSSVILFSSCLQSFPVIGSFLMSTFFTSVGQRIEGFELRCWIRLLRVPWTTRRTNQSMLREINPEYSLEGQMLKLKLQYFGQLM